MAEITNVFRFLKEFNELSNPVITEIDKQKWHLSISEIPIIEEIQSAFLGHEMDEMIYLVVRRPNILSCPKPPVILIEWILSDWQKLNVSKIDVFEKKTREEIDEKGNLVYVDEYFNQDADRIRVFQEWYQNRDKWREAMLPKQQGLDLYNNLFHLYSEMKKESESVELVLGDGHLRWYSSERVIDHPVLLQKVQLDFNAHIPEFIISCEEKKTEIYTPMLRVISSINQKMLSDIIRDTEETGYDISDIENTGSLFKRIINVIDNQGRYIESPSEINKVATIHSAPKVFLRKRTLGFSNFIDVVLGELEKNEDIELPEFFGTMTGVYKEKTQKDIVEKSWNYNGIDKDVLLTLPANSEQLRIIKYLEKYGAVLVQGPPGTGKTHTIANLIGHLLSRGNSVLVTSHTEKALSVLKEKVYKDKYNPDLNLQNLCISLLSSTSQKKEMDEAINEIAQKSTSLDLHASKIKIEKLDLERSLLIDASKELTEELVSVRSMEYSDLVYDNSTIRPIDAAKFLNEGSGIFDYIKGPSKNNKAGIPLTYDELVLLYASNDQVNSEEENLLKKDFPNKDKLLTPRVFCELVDEKQNLILKLENSQSFMDIETDLEASILQNLVEEGNALLLQLNGFEKIDRALIDKTLKDPAYPKLWEHVIAQINLLEGSYETYRMIHFEDDFTYSEDCISHQNLKIINEIVDSNKEKPIGLFSKGEWKALKSAITINGKTIEHRSDFVKLYDVLKYEVEKNEVVKRLRKLLTDVVVIDHDLFNDFEDKIRRYKERFIRALKWYRFECETYFCKIEDTLNLNKENDFIKRFSIQELNDVIGQLEMIVNVVQSIIYRDRLQEVELFLNEHKNYLDEFSSFNSYGLELLKAMQNDHKEHYQSCYDSLIDLIQKNKIVELRQTLISKIRTLAPLLAKEIESRESIHSSGKVPEHFEKAWKHFQLRNQIERLDALKPGEIQRKIETNNLALLKNAQHLAYEKAWFEKISNQTDQQNQALQGWRNTIKQIGKGTGKNAPMLRAKARELMPLCQSAIPVWIMPLNRVVENFDPRNNKFDVIIIDEASQANILSLAALYLGEKVIIVGDDEQVSPDSFGVKTDEINALVLQHLERIPNNHLYNSLTSLYDMAKSSGFKPLMLTEHFRCLPEIIEFSNQLSYSGRIKPLRDDSDVVIKPSVVEYRVPGGFKNNKKVNDAEVSHIVSIIRAMIEMEEYKNQTIGVISMLGHEQSTEIEKKLQMEIDPVVFEERRIQCGTPPQFQGDERDIILLSLVDSPNETGGPLRLLSEDGNNDKYRKRYNVAVSRARNQLWVVHSLNPEIDLKSEDLRLKLIKYAMNPNKETDSLLSLSESPFEFEVMQYLLNQRYQVIPQFKVGAYRIDMVIKDGDNKVALECDGEKFHTIENLENDLARQAILERLGWRFIRIRGSAYYRDKANAMTEVVNSLDKYGVKPVFETIVAEPQQSNLILNKLKNIAMQYREEDTKEQIMDVVDTDAQLDKRSLTLVEIADEKLIVCEPVKQHDEPEKFCEGIENIIEGSIDGEMETTEAVEQQKVSDLVVEEDKVVDLKPAFDFRLGKSHSTTQKTASKSIDKPILAETITESDSTKLQKPKFDFRSKK